MPERGNSVPGTSSFLKGGCYKLAANFIHPLLMDLFALLRVE